VQGASDPASRREYYDSVLPEFIHVTETSFVERELCGVFEMQMCKTQYVP
jgi:hypothetical protein